MGRFCHHPGKIAVVLGAHLYRSHDERELGFRSVLRSEFRHLDIVDLIAGNDSSEENFERVTECAKRHDLVGIYVVGGGIAGAARALHEMKKTQTTCMIGHNLCSLTKRLLLNGTLDAIIHQDMAEIADSALEQLTGSPEETTLGSIEIPIQIVMRENIAAQFNSRIPLPSFESSLIQDREAETRVAESQL
jgi:LacI family transcriptional regulator